MLDEFKKAQRGTSEKEDEKEHIVLPDTADPTRLAEDGKPMTPQLQEIYDMRKDIADGRPKANEIMVRETDLPEDRGKTVNSALRYVPKLCDQCYLIDKCPHYEPGATCYYRNQITVKDSKSLVDLLRMLLEMQGERVLFGRLIEQSEGGYLDQNLSKEMKLLMDMMKDFKEVISPPKEEITIKASGPARQEGGGIIAQLFGVGGGQQEQKKHDDVVDVEGEDG